MTGSRNFNFLKIIYVYIYIMSKEAEVTVRGYKVCERYNKLIKEPKTQAQIKETLERANKYRDSKNTKLSHMAIGMIIDLKKFFLMN